MIEYILLAIVKIGDNIVQTAKSISTYKEQKILSSILTIISQLMFYLIISRVIEDNTLLAIIVVSISSGIGNYLAFEINSRFKKDDKWWIYVTTSEIDVMKELCEYLVLNNIKYGALNGFNRRGDNSIHVVIFSKTKEESRLVRAFLDSSDKKYLIEIIR